MTSKQPSAPRSVALVGPYSSGKTTLLENLLAAAGALTRKGTIKERNTVGDSSAEGRARQMSVEVSAATFEFMGETFTLLDCPGSVEFQQECYDALVGVDAALVVCEPEIERAVAMGPILRFLDERRIPHMLFINKMDRAAVGVREILAALQQVSRRPLVLRQVPIRDADSISGYIDLVHERAYQYQANKESALIQIPESMIDQERAARTGMLEALADFDDKLLESLLEDRVPPTREIFASLHKDFEQDLLVPVLLGAAEHQHGIRRLLKAMRHDVPEPQHTAERVGMPEGEGAVVQVLKTYQLPQSGKMSLVRVWRGTLKDGATLGPQRVGSINRMFGQTITKVASAEAGEIVALGRMDQVQTGALLASGAAVKAPEAVQVQVLAPVYSLAVSAVNRADEVKLSDAFHKLVEEDRSLRWESNMETHELVLHGQGEIHLQVVMDRLRNKYNLPLVTRRPQVPYKETIRKPADHIHGRHKKQTGGHGQFGDVYIDIKPLPRGGGIKFNNAISGGVVPRNYIPAVEQGVVDYCKRGPLGFQVVDVDVTLTDGTYHTVDSSEMAFQTAARIAMNEGMPKCQPVLLEPVDHVDVHVPNDFTSQVQRVLSGRRGQILGYGPREGWHGWDTVSAQVPQSELHDLIIELRSLTRGTGTFSHHFDHLQELSGRLADQIVAAAAAAQ